MDEDKEESVFRTINSSDVTVILTAAFFAVGFLAMVVWIMTTDDPFGDFIPTQPHRPPQAQEQVVPGVVNVTVPEKAKTAPNKGGTVPGNGQR